MKVRHLRALLSALREAGVTEYVEGPVTIRLGPPPPAPGKVAQPLPDMDAMPEGEPGEVDIDEQLELPPGVYDPRARIAEINRKAADRRKGIS